MVAGSGLAQWVSRSRCAATRDSPARLHAPATRWRTTLGGIGRVGARNVTNTVRQPRTITHGQVRGERLADIARERKAVAIAAFAAHTDLTLTPVQIVKLQARDLDRAQPESCEQHQDREVPRPDQGRPVTTQQEPFNIGAWDRLGNGALAPGRDRRDRVSQREVDQAAQAQEPRFGGKGLSI
jgi:hypothetical protein